MQVAKFERQPCRWSPRATWYELGFPNGWLTRTCGVMFYEFRRARSRALPAAGLRHRPRADVPLAGSGWLRKQLIQMAMLSQVNAVAVWLYQIPDHTEYTEKTP